MQIFTRNVRYSISKYLLRRANFILIIAILTLFAGVTMPIFGQTSFGRISGTVFAPDGSVVAGAQVTVRNSDTQLTRQTSTDSQGFYVFTELPIGTYSVDINQSGFSKATRNGLSLVADGRLTADFTLAVGSTNQTIEVQ